MANFTNDKINAVWEKAKKVDGFDPDLYRQDVGVAWIQKDKFGKEECFGWEIDHMFPDSLGGNENSLNLQALKWENNRSKADSFPSYITSVSTEGKSYILKVQSWEFTDSFLTTLKQLYPNNLTLRRR